MLTGKCAMSPILKYTGRSKRTGPVPIIAHIASP